VIDDLPLVDVHVHAARLDTLKPSWERWVLQRRVDGDPAELYDHDAIAPDRFAAWLDREGVDVAFLLAEYSPRVTGIQAVEDLLPLVRHNRDRLRLMANINPHVHHPAVGELERQLGLGATVVKIHPVHGGFPANARELYPMYRLCEQEQIPVVFHVGTSTFPGTSNRFADPLFVEDVANDFPDLTIVLAHGGRGWWYDAAAFIAQMRDNVWIDIGGLPPGRIPQYYRNQNLARLARKFIFGSDWPGCPGIRANARAVIDLGFDRSTLEGILYRNAAMVYRLGAVEALGAGPTKRTKVGEG
jgi:predicted TIM-barrel fold metal-dependent hydrolase